ncbi:MAG: hypothetical protein NUW23_15525 [Firmicutes bacterium]|jgi:hypothetical protein|nr:hypothetical protein [Bacillota bacterium]
MPETAGSLPSVLRELHNICPGVKFNVIFECGNCCFKAKNVEDIDEKGGSLVLKSPECDFIRVFTINPRTVLKEKALAVVIPREKVCAIEVESPECRQEGE